VSSVAEKLAAVIALVDGWMEGFGPGTPAHNVMGKQVVSVEFVHQQVHAIVDAPTTAAVLEPCPQCGPGIYMCEHTMPKVVNAEVFGVPQAYANTPQSRQQWRDEILEARRSLPAEQFAGWLNRRINAARGGDG
jgi:hypothetical protein